MDRNQLRSRGPQVLKSSIYTGSGQLVAQFLPCRSLVTAELLQLRSRTWDSVLMTICQVIQTHCQHNRMLEVRLRGDMHVEVLVEAMAVAVVAEINNVEAGRLQRRYSMVTWLMI